MSRWDEMGAASQVDQIAALIAKLDSDLAAQATGESGAAAPPVFRFVVATDWSSPAVPFAALRGYCTMLAPGAPAELVFAVPHDPGESDLAAVRALFEGIDEVTDSADLRIESFGEAAGKPCYAAIIPNGDHGAALMELTQFFVALHQIALLVRDPGRLAAEPVPQLRENSALKRRFAGYREFRAGPGVPG